MRVNPHSGRLSESETPVLVLGGSVTALGAIRSLGALGIPVFAACDRNDLAARSRWTRLLNSSLPEFSTVESLAAYLDALPFVRAVLLPCSDAWAEAVAMLPAEIATRFPSYVSSPAVLRRLTDKEQFATLVREHGIPHPQTLFVHTVADLERHDLAPDTQYFLKARNSQQFIAKTGVKAYMVASAEEARFRVADLTAAGLGVVLQEYVPGPPSNHYFVDGFAADGGKVVARFARQRLRMHPPHFGNSTYMRSVALAQVPDIVATVDRLIEASGLRGIFSVELKRDQKTGIAKVLEVNARAWWYVHYATACGVNVCEMAYRAALGEPLPPFDGSYRVGRTCVFVRPDYRAWRAQSRDQPISLASCVVSWLGGEHMIFLPSDPMPFVHRCVDSAKQTFRRLAVRA
jgi:predicted ATP-grasp superfamily ATP-dependent carboligase